MRGWLLLVVLAMLAGACQTTPTEEEGAQQHAWGEEMHAFHCARCHAPDRSAPPLTSETLLATHTNALELYEFIEETMPLDAPGSLAERDYLAITAYLLDREELLTLPAEERLTADNAELVDLGETPLDIEGDDDAEGGDDGLGG